MNRIIRAGLIGFGFAGRTFHAPVITAAEGIELAAVVQRSGDEAAVRYPKSRIYRDVGELYADPTIDLVVVTTPSTEHYRFAKEALLAGKHVVVEKPFTVTSAEADELIALAKGAGLILSVYHNRRWDGDFLTIAKLLEEGALGDIVEAEFCWDRYRPNAGSGWRNVDEPGAGTFYDLGVHFLDQALCLFGRPETIRADLRTTRVGAKAVDAFDVALGYGSGGPAVRLKSSLLVQKPGPRYILHGTRGSFVKFGEDPQEQALKAGGTGLEPGWGQESPEFWGDLHADWGGLRVTGKVETLPGRYAAYYENVAAAIVGTRALQVLPEHARMAVRLIELGMQSDREKRTIRIEEE
ncbi:oxidoreductase [Paenibacillus antri]|uniref:Oxidoreductase n=1 Tax=Paenibacillus antri TaxID=2582848 RepID=A0A5R9GDH6_9BACL|nr:oxidoreductase [Paenibacillus antri]TLS53801.1 oxidoreductase [Paenibacillus antri]